MKKKLGLLFVIAIILGLGILLFSDRIDFERDEARVNLAKAYREIDKLDFSARKGNAEGDVAYEEGSNVVDDLEAQAKAEYINSLKDIFDKNMHLLESGDDEDVLLDLKMFKQGEEYHFADLFWNITFEQVEKGLEDYLLEDPGITPASDGYMYYFSRRKYVLYDQPATTTFEFYDDQLKRVQLAFTPDEKPKKVKSFFKKTANKLIDIYGKEYVKEENDTIDYVSYLWNGEETMLQIELIDSGVVISLGVKEE